MHDRRIFLKKLGSMAVIAGTTTLIPRFVQAKDCFEREDRLHKVTLLHTNDVHSRIEPFPLDGGKNQGKAGIAKRAALIRKIRQEEKEVLLLDAGDMFQGTPYFNYFGGEIEMKLMSKMGYDAATIGNHDFDGGIKSLHTQYSKHGNFDLINCNYDFHNTIMHDACKPYQIYQKGAIKIGVLGLGVELDGLVPNVLYKETQYLPPIKNANKIAAILKNEEKCDYVICLSHLGYQHKNKVSDRILARESKNIDLIIGGHTHTFLEHPVPLQNQSGQEVFITQVGWAGIILGRIDLYFEQNFSSKCMECKNSLI